MKRLRKLNLLLWKNYLIQKRTPVRTLSDLLMPLIMCGVLVILRFMVAREEINHPVTYAPFPLEDCRPNEYILAIPWNIAFSPDNSNLARTIMERTVENINAYGVQHNIEGFPNENALEDRVLQSDDNVKNAMFAGVVFDETNLTQEYPTDLKIKIRFFGLSRVPDWNSTTLDTQAPNWKTHMVFPLYQPFGPRDAHSKVGGQPGYCEEGFIYLQNALYEQAAQYYNNYSEDTNKTWANIDFQRFPYPSYTKDLYLPALILFISVFIIITYTYSSVSTIKMVTIEKETQMKGAMRIMGLPNWMHWTAWSIKEIIQWSIPSIFITILLTFEWADKGCVLKYTNPLVLFTILITFSITSIMFCFLISVCFNRANSAATVGSALWFVTYSPYMVMQPHYENMGLWELKLWSLISNTNIGYIFQFLVNYEGAGVGLQWSNLFETTSPIDKITTGNLLLTLLFDAFLYFCLTIYIETAFPGHYGIAKPWYFPFQLTYWFGYDRSHRDKSVSEKGVQIKNLTKVYKNGKKAVDNLSMKMHEDQITILLGHNGAGKSTTMSLLSGLIKPTSGTAYINGFDIWSEMSHIRDRLGLCPQYNLLFPELTIKEHLLFFGTLKGRSGKELDDEINKYVKMLEMESKLNTYAAALSGGYQRKLSVAIALVGKSKIVLIDEPTAGMDPNARRRLWDLLQMEREGRTMLMTTHLMDEADVLGDRVAILSGGQLKCIGTPFNLKTDPEGYRYTLNLIKASTSAPVDSERITAFMRSYCEPIRLQSDSRTEIKYKIKDSNMLPKLLTALHINKSKFGIVDFGISLTSLEDIYMRITSEATKSQIDDPSAMKDSTKNGSVASMKSYMKSHSKTKSESLYAVSKKAPSKFSRWKRQYEAMLMKKMLVSYRSWMLHFIQIFITVIFMIIALIVTLSWRGSTDLIPLQFSLNTFKDPIIVLKKTNTNFANSSGIYNHYIDKFLGPIVENQGGSLKYVVEEENDGNDGAFIDKYILDQYAIEGLEEVNERYLAAYELNISDSITAVKVHFNNQPFHIIPTVLNVLHNITFKYMTKDENSISFVNEPFPYLPGEKLKKLEGGSNLGFQVGFNTGFAQAFVAGIFLLNILKEKVTGAQHLQFVSGVSASAYWSASVMWDFIMYLLPLFAEIFVIYLFQDESYSNCEQIAQLFTLLMFYNWAIIPIVNLSSYMFNTPSLGFLVISIFGVITGCSLYLIHLIIEIRPLHKVTVARNMEKLLIWFPHYALCNGLRNIYANHDSHHLSDYKGNYAWEEPGIGRNLTVLFAVGLVANIALLSLDSVQDKGQKLLSIIKKYSSHFKKNSNPTECELQQVTTISSFYEDRDIIQEKSVVEKSANVDYCVLIKNVSKSYGKTLAVKNTNLALSAHECFVLLGTNGAGKTTTFKMLTTYEKVTSGSISVCSMDIVRERKQVLQLIGYCPQQDGLIDKLTGRETLRMFCTLRGIDREEHDLVISQLSVRLQFRRMLDTLVMNYSGGMKRKLSTAVAMIGDPPVILLDEPTSGMDPDARAHLWNVVQEERARGKCVIITTHSLEECETLCTRLAIMVEGEIRCIGSTQYLKNKYASGHKLYVKFPTKLLENVKLHVSTHLPGSSIHEEFMGVILFQIPSEIPCSKIFSAMEEAKTESIIEDYSIQQTSLEQVFTQITKKP